jgi:hypothetical protein
VLHAATTCLGGESGGIAGNSDSTLEAIYDEILFQCEKNPRIGYGIKDKGQRPYRHIDFNSGFHFEMRLCGDKGQQFRGWHVSKFLLGDEVALWKNPKQFGEFFSRAKPGCIVGLASTPDGDYSGPFFAICARAESIDGRSTHQTIADADIASAPSKTPKFKKINVRKYDLPAPMWSESRAAILEDQYGGRDSLGWQTNVEGAWGSAAYSIFPAVHLEPCLKKRLPDFRMVRVTADRKESRLYVDAARLSGVVDTVDGSRQEEILEHDRFPFIRPEDIARRICAYFPDISEWRDPVLHAGADVGSATDPTEIQFARASGGRLQHFFRLNAKALKWTEQEVLFRFLDHFSGHRAQFGIDNGSAGSMLVQALTTKTENCPVCERPIDLEERVRGFGFGESNDLVDLTTGQPVMNPDKTDNSGNPVPMRFRNKEASTRYLEKIMQDEAWDIANDAGAGDPKLSGPQLLMNHTSTGLNGKGERDFKAVDDHYPDSWRQLVLSYVFANRGEPVLDPGPETVATARASRTSSADLDDVGFASARSGFDDGIAAGSIGGFFGDGA